MSYHLLSKNKYFKNCTLLTFITKPRRNLKRKEVKFMYKVNKIKYGENSIKWIYIQSFNQQNKRIKQTSV